MLHPTQELELPANPARFNRRIGVLLERTGMVMNPKKLYRLYREEGLPVRHRRCRKRARISRSPLPNGRWSTDFVSDAFGASRRFLILALNLHCCRENFGLISDTSISGAGWQAS